MPNDAPDLSRARLEQLLATVSLPLDNRGRTSREKSEATETLVALYATLSSRVIELEAALGRYYEALRAIEVMPEQGGCDDGVDAVEMWTMMRKVARAALETPNAK